MDGNAILMSTSHFSGRKQLALVIYQLQVMRVKKLTHSVLNRGGQDKPQLHLISYRFPILIFTSE